MSAPVNTVSNAVVNLLSRSRIKNRKRSARSPRSISKVAGLLGDPVVGGVGGSPGDVHAEPAVLDREEEVEAAEEDGIDVGQVDGEDGVGLRGQGLSPDRTPAASPRSRTWAGAVNRGGSPASPLTGRRGGSACTTPTPPDRQRKARAADRVRLQSPSPRQRPGHRARPHPEPRQPPRRPAGSMVITEPGGAFSTLRPPRPRPRLRGRWSSLPQAGSGGRCRCSAPRGSAAPARPSVATTGSG